MFIINICAIIKMLVIFSVVLIPFWKISKYLSYDSAFLTLIVGGSFVLVVSLILIMIEKNNMNFITTIIYPITTKYIFSNFYYIQHFKEILREKNIDSQKALFDKSIMQKTKDKVYTFCIAMVYILSLFSAYLLQSFHSYFGFSTPDLLFSLACGVFSVCLGLYKLKKVL